MKSIAIITARGGSKRIPKKNIKKFLGKPIISYSIDAALKSEIFSEVMVSTDSEEIAEIAKKAGANVPFFRSDETSNDFATTNDVLEEVLNKYAEQEQFYDAMCCIYPTAPFITPEKLKNAAAMIENGIANSIMPVVQYSYPPQRSNIIRNGVLEYQYPEYLNSRSQDLEPVYHDAGQFYFYKIFNGTEWFSQCYAPIIVSEIEVQDIDTPMDWQLAEVKYKILTESR